ncbi:IclR family transcriptional regulator [Pseudonocardia abyssalis]|uniref:IclR family transcriptional regulator n=1 Tax=Pseudonocardia abyssalis TaxID=2792008 RepID=A0ABS6UQ98_9PSEU|nr:IclR family transcriptional regulator [Pseudonocardia abyssalis]MBW0114792.1 IclR family transcriptional regulator [Pseudonocardia abyssalis]MBW0133964.1 IclR family transcriptional regulator [Pseudonocardia abyssalis]
MPRTGYGESVLTRAVRILDAFGPDDRTLRVSDIAARSGLHLATASRLVAELVEHGLLARDPDRRVRVGVRLWELAMRASPTLSLRDAAMPFLEDLHAVVGHHVQLGVRDGSEVLFVERLSAPGSVVNYTRIAGRLPLHASSSGLVLLAHAPHDVQESVLALPLRRYTAQTITTADRLRRTLADVRRDGFVLCPGHIHDDALGVAVPVADGSRRVVAAIAAVVPDDDSGRAVVPVLRAAARGISRSLPLTE